MDSLFNSKSSEFSYLKKQTKNSIEISVDHLSLSMWNISLFLKFSKFKHHVRKIIEKYFDQIWTIETFWNIFFYWTSEIVRQRIFIYICSGPADTILHI